LWLLGLTVLVCCVLYPLLLWGIGQAAFRDQADGSLITGPDGKVVGSRLIAQPFTGDEYFQPRPSAVSYNAAASGASNWGASNPRLRDRVARALGPVVGYAGGPRKGQPVGPDVEDWLRKDQFRGKPGVVAQWAEAYPTLAQNWVKADKLNADYVAAWKEAHPGEVAGWVRDNPGTPDPKAEDLAVPFFVSYAKTFPGTFPGIVEHKTPGGQTEKRVEPVRAGTDIQATFFDVWLQDNPGVELEEVPADMVMASGSGLDPHITLKNARYQLDRVAGKWAEITKRGRAEVRQELEDLLRQRAEAPLGGLLGVEIVNVLEMNLALRGHFGPATAAR
jgi:K+-transporting ATPase ATPase C chain